MASLFLRTYHYTLFFSAWQGGFFGEIVIAGLTRNPIKVAIRVSHKKTPRQARGDKINDFNEYES